MIHTHITHAFLADKNGAKHDRALYADLLNTGAARILSLYSFDMANAMLQISRRRKSFLL